MNTTDIHIANPERLAQTIHAIKRDGVSRLHVLADFDRTLTRAHSNGREIPSMIALLRDGHYLTHDYAEKAHGLYQQYHPIEIDLNVSTAEKKQAMHEWWSKHFELLIASKLNKRDIHNAIESNHLQLRPHTADFLRLLHLHAVPVVILSASGLGIEPIQWMLKEKDCLFDNMNVISNVFEWDSDGYAVSVREPIIHAMNKDETVIPNIPEVFAAVKDRPNVLLFGDSLGDLEMVTGFDYRALLKIGFLDEGVEEAAEAFGAAFDVVLTNDAPMTYVLGLVQQLISDDLSHAANV